MNETITLPKLISLVVKANECTPAEARKFVHDFFALIEQSLSEGEMVSIKGVGTFARTDNPAAPIKFQADNDLAAAVNEPFSAFQAVELNDGVTDEMLQEQPQAPVAQAEPTPAAEPAPTPATEPAQVIAQEATPEVKDEPATIPQDNLGDEHSSTVQTAPSNQSVPEPDQPKTVEKPQPTFSVPPLAEDEEELASDTDINGDDSDATSPSHRGLWFVLGLLLGLIAGLIGGYIAGRNVVDTSSDDIDRIMAEVDSLRQVGITDTIASDIAADSISTPSASQTAQAPKTETNEVFDTVRSGYYLTTMAGKHYGHKNYWVFIYQANPGLGNPNTIGPGTRVKIPPVESFAESTEEATKAKAQQILNELHAKYNI